MNLYEWEIKSSLPCEGNFQRFFSIVNIWISKPHCLNKKIGGTDYFELGFFRDEIIHKCIKYFSENLTSLNSSEDLDESIKCLVEKFHENFPESDEPKNDYKVIVRFIYPKSGKYFSGNVELIITDNVKQGVIFTNLVNDRGRKLSVSSPYAVLFENRQALLYTVKSNCLDEDLIWLKNILLPKLVWWMENNANSNSIHSNRLISTSKYLVKYAELKEKYLGTVSQFWTESTNPEKFISEDIAIASYLLVLWGCKIQSFVDLGCGNGLLVYILSSEGHNGFGIDVRARKIWSSYPSFVILKEETISPSLDYIFPETNWLIGNHSDELTPWIPIIAARSSSSTNFFLLPCCPFELNGQKYVRKDTSQSTYLDYMDYLETICDGCNFELKRDRLKIPSTKRICFIGKQRINSLQRDFNSENIKNFVELKLKNLNGCNVKLRSKEEKVRNCTQLDKEYLHDVVLSLSQFIINSSPDSNSWREGDFIPISSLIKVLPQEKRKFLQSQCGGLQTLLKNHHYIFLVSKGMVKLRKPTVLITPPRLIKEKMCWFFLHHPDSCPLSDEHCTYKHKN